MGLILRTNSVMSSLEEKLYKDALVSTGTLLLHDYSNRGTLYGFSLKEGFPARDLADFDSIDNDTKIHYNTESGNPELTKGLGVPMWLWGVNSGSANQYGFNLGKDLLNYLSANNNHEFLFSFWVRKNSELENASGAFVTSTQNVGGNTVNAIRVNSAANGNITPSFGGVSATTGINTSDGNLHKISLHYKGVGETVSVYRNRDYGRESVNPAPGFGSDSSDLIIGKIDTANPPYVLYRLMIEDLTVSGRTPAELVEEDWDYCHGLGKYSGTNAKRPFIENL